MSILAIALLFLSASLHTLWNLLLKQSGQKFITSWWIVTIGAIIFMPVLLFSGLPPRNVWLFALISAGLEAAYILFLSVAYKFSDFSLAYPMARGTAPAFLLAWSLLFLQGTMIAIARICITGCWIALCSRIENTASELPIFCY